MGMSYHCIMTDEDRGTGLFLEEETGRLAIAVARDGDFGFPLDPDGGRESEFAAWFDDPTEAFMVMNPYVVWGVTPEMVAKANPSLSPEERARAAEEATAALATSEEAFDLAMGIASDHAAHTSPEPALEATARGVALAYLEQRGYRIDDPGWVSSGGMRCIAAHDPESGEAVLAYVDAHGPSIEPADCEPQRAALEAAAREYRDAAGGRVRGDVIDICVQSPSEAGITHFYSVAEPGAAASLDEIERACAPAPTAGVEAPLPKGKEER